MNKITGFDPEPSFKRTSNSLNHNQPSPQPPRVETHQTPSLWWYAIAPFTGLQIRAVLQHNKPQNCQLRRQLQITSPDHICSLSEGGRGQSFKILKNLFYERVLPAVIYQSLERHERIVTSWKVAIMLRRNRERAPTIIDTHRVVVDRQAATVMLATH